ncbi:Proline-specific permease [Colletotrichum orbiculare MAFF 240422]|uniref:Proline-specific permease n=1 Tax=Colletotrichum orbiculare (strain 104-T / ATCC 96160 / CBS 514.97 / LARS 414 / MAFF 240422) TaxID=1213857 RepID=A0A484FFJ0_COLOR|nr:Proline-specific permease [Colletotrichum orbiculare MAFF 240422]
MSINNPKLQDLSPTLKASSSVRQSSVERGQVQTFQPNEQTHRGFKPRHAQMISLGGAIGTSLFLGTAQVLRVGGPGFLLLAYGLLSIMVYGIVTAIAEVGTYLPVPGGTMSYYGNEYVSRSLGFAMGYLYWYSLGILVPYELVAVNLLFNYWPWGPSINPAVWITVLLLVIVALNCLPPRAFGEAEFWSAGMKILLILGLIFLSVVLFFGGGPNKDMLGFRYWRDPGATKTYLVHDASAGRFVSFLQAMVLSSFAFVLAPEYLIVTAGEMQSPRRTLPRAAQRYVWRLIILFIPIVIGIGVVCPHDDPSLSSSGTARSPFIIAIRHAGIPVLDNIVNAMILLSAATAGNAFLYQSSRNLYSLAVCGDAPAIFKRCNKHGLPYMAVGASSLFGLLAYLSLSNTSLTVFNWLINITNTSGYISWVCCGVVYFKFKAAAAYHGVESPFKPRVQPWGMYFGVCGSVFLLLLNGFTVFFPGQWSLSDFLTAYISIPAFLAIYFGHKVLHWKDDWNRRPEDVDMFAGLEEVLAAEKPPPARNWLAKRLMALIE